MAKAAELREMSDEQLALTLKEAREQLFRRRLQAQTERLDSPSETCAESPVSAAFRRVSRTTLRSTPLFIRARTSGHPDSSP